MSLFLIILAAGDSKRLKSNTPKPFHIINNNTLLEYSFDTFKNIREIKKTVIVYNKKHKKHLDKLRLKNILKVVGGKTRQESTFKALKRIKRMNCKKVIIHDAARPNPSKKLINEMISKLKKNDAVVPTIKVNDATKRAKKNMIFKNIQRNSLRFSQTPQGFTFKKIYEKHKKNINTIFDDDSALFTEDDEKVITINGSKSNLKITDSEDLNIFSNLKKRKTYSGIGFDIHKLVKGRKLYLGGIKVAYPLGLKGHSDADPVVHAIIDSLLGACGLGDIGKLFSDKNKKYKNIRSTTLLKKIIKLIKSKNFSINNVDINIIAQKPKIKKYSKKMIQTISKLCEINSNQINIKGKTTEKLGLVGQGEAIVSEVISSVTKYDQ
ncbi:MAG: 2-C-methyl-D-erythritol 2,4-cyclodiphosphate synthase [Pelagibacteraceae bacterium]|jgi:2-C-methyl-D-erythritol 4-phosphate cytidylyltransferase/2-C-methyl-D-erythritol 2,4-cyclodiphosphate synthase|nr:2-C-methyl-D-erythritol 2,4-cyclodiphosphate synthase [Pelagibacteraceae bacterium]MDP6709820.1 2-C-methyl-D-erythritol 2,4-cyclodiphosphate synthase [Pelagibacteraceae bacterium]|tara:strand:+ start:1004 stop:2143 length:1140 start_codon:yes stop_codon:yes gene_type:complete